jgi:hypothetical protein
MEIISLVKPTERGINSPLVPGDIWEDARGIIFVWNDAYWEHSTLSTKGVHLFSSEFNCSSQRLMECMRIYPQIFEYKDFLVGIVSTALSGDGVLLFFAQMAASHGADRAKEEMKKFL